MKRVYYFVLSTLLLASYACSNGSMNVPQDTNPEVEISSAPASASMEGEWTMNHNVPCHLFLRIDNSFEMKDGSTATRGTYSLINNAITLSFDDGTELSGMVVEVDGQKYLQFSMDSDEVIMFSPAEPSESQPSYESQNAGFGGVFRGTISGTASAEMVINGDGRGTFKYDCNGTMAHRVVSLDSYTEHTGHVVVTEYDTKGNYIGQFDGTFGEGWYAGTFTNYKGISVPFELMKQG